MSKEKDIPDPPDLEQLNNELERDTEKERYAEHMKKIADEGRIRPIAIQESVLNLFHLLILKEIKVELSPFQRAMRPGALQECAILAKNIHKTHKLVSLDISNAFNCVPFKVIEEALTRNKTPGNIVQYVLTMLKTRYSA